MVVLIVTQESSHKIHQNQKPPKEKQMVFCGPTGLNHLSYVSDILTETF